MINDLRDTPRVSVLMTTYNTAPFLRDSIDSVLAQSFSNWELIVVEDGSTDDTPKILAEYKDPRIRVFPFLKNIGRTPALRYAFDQARGEYIAILDADDMCHPQRFIRQKEFLDQHPETVLVGSWAQHMDRTGAIFNTWEPPTDSNDLHECLGWIDPIVHSSAMYRRESALAVGGYPKEYIYAQDFALILELAQKGRLAMISEYLCKLRVFPGNMSNSPKYAMDVAREGLQLIRYAGQQLPLSPQGRLMNRRSIAKYEIRCALATCRCGDVFLGVTMMLRALSHEPSILWNNNLFRQRFRSPK